MIIEDLEGEIWKDIVGFEGLYQISNMCRVKSLERITPRLPQVPQITKERIRKNGTNAFGYCTVVLCKNGKHHTRMIHTEIMKAFVPNPENKRTVNHINGIKTYNRFENLEWATDKENVTHAYEMGLNKRHKFLVSDQNDEVIKECYSIPTIAKYLKLCSTSVHVMLVTKKKTEYRGLKIQKL